MTSLAALWLPILLSALFVFVASSILWVALPIHKSEYRQLPNEEACMNALASHPVKPGFYVFPWSHTCETSGTKADPERNAKGPWGQLLIAGGPPKLGATLACWFVFLVLFSILIGYVAALALAPGATFFEVFRGAGFAALLGYGGGVLPRFIWERKPPAHLPATVVDAIVYTCVTAATFAWLWPSA